MNPMHRDGDGCEMATPLAIRPAHRGVVQTRGPARRAGLLPYVAGNGVDSTAGGVRDRARQRVSNAVARPR
jgi:hypothetical protein